MLLNINQCNSYDVYYPTELIHRLLGIKYEVGGGQSNFQVLLVVPSYRDIHYRRCKLHSNRA